MNPSKTGPRVLLPGGYVDVTGLSFHVKGLSFHEIHQLIGYLKNLAIEREAQNMDAALWPKKESPTPDPGTERFEGVMEAESPEIVKMREDREDREVIEDIRTTMEWSRIVIAAKHLDEYFKQRPEIHERLTMDGQGAVIALRNAIEGSETADAIRKDWGG